MSAVLHTAKTVRGMLLQRVQEIPETLFDVQPEGFNNTIRWNIGHIAATLEFFFSQAVGFNSNLPQSYPSLFGPGTKPADWTIAPPSKEELVQILTAQREKFAEIDPARLEQRLDQPLKLGPHLQFETAAEVVNFAMIHEAMHSQTIHDYVRLVQHKKQGTTEAEKL